MRMDIEAEGAPRDPEGGREIPHERATCVSACSSERGCVPCVRRAERLVSGSCVTTSDMIRGRLSAWR